MIANVSKPEEHRSTIYDIFDDKGTRFVFVFGKTKEGEIYVARANERLIMEDLQEKKRELKEKGSKIVIDPQVIQDFTAIKGGPEYDGVRFIKNPLNRREAKIYEKLYMTLQELGEYKEEYYDKALLRLSEKIRRRYGEEMEEAFIYLAKKNKGNRYVRLAE
jgi:hypothetical protein